MVKSELKRALSSKAFLLTLCLAFSMLIIGGIDYLQDWTGDVTSGTYLDKFLMSFGYGMTCLIAILFPVVVLFPYALSYRKERDSGYQQLMILKTSRSRYRFAKMIAVACSGFLSLFLPVFVWFLICRFSMNKGNPEYSIVNGLRFAEWLYESCPFLYGMIYVLNAGIQGAVFAVLGLGLSAVIRNRYLAALLPFCYCIFTAAVVDEYCMALNALTLMVIGQYFNHTFGYVGILLYDIVLLFLGCSLFIGGDIHACKA